MPVDFHIVLLTAFLNPVVAVVAFFMGRSADQWQKLPLAAFAASLAGMAAVYVGARLGFAGLAGTGRAAAGIFIAQCVLALVWAYAGYRLARQGVVTLLRLWLAATAVGLAGIAVWAFAPVLVFMVLLLAALGFVAAAMIALARSLQAWRERR